MKTDENQEHEREAMLMTMASKKPPRFEQIRDTTAKAGRCWYLIHSGVQAEKRVQEMLDRRGFDSYCPVMRRMVTPSRNRVSKAQRDRLHLLARPVDTPLFARYVFTLFDLENDNWHDIFKDVGVHGIRSFGGKPYPVDEAFVAKLRRLEVGGAIPGILPVRVLMYAVGELVRISEGPFSGFNGTIEELDESDRGVLLVNFLGRMSSVELELSQFEKL